MGVGFLASSTIASSDSLVPTSTPIGTDRVMVKKKKERKGKVKNSYQPIVVELPSEPG